MNTSIPTAHEDVDALAASAFALARDCDIAIREDVLHNLGPLERTGPGRVLRAIEHHNIFDRELLVEIDVLMGKLDQLIAAGTTEVWHFDASENNVSAPDAWKEHHRNHQAGELSRALVTIRGFRNALLAVHDLMHAERAIERLRQAT